MEQQTISITKAGVKACLNARTSILAAANPINGRYDKTKSLKQNIQMSAPIMSRFDLFFILVDDCNEVTDYAIARKIVDLHSKREQSVDRVYQPEEIRWYLVFSRLFKPKVTEEAMEFLVEQYRHLRQRDSGGGVKSSWRITVRQLESMVRLSEAMARLHCSDQVLPKHVKEAYRLLNKSIIRVDQPEVHFDDDDGEEDAVEDLADDNAVGAQNEPMETKEEAHSQRKQMRLPYEEYRAMANLIVFFLRRKDAEAQEKGELSSMKKSDVLNWYLEETGRDIESQMELLEKKQIAEKVLERLMYHDKILIPLSKSGLGQKKGAAASVEDTEDEDPVLIVHPNYVTDE